MGFSGISSAVRFVLGTFGTPDLFQGLGGGGEARAGFPEVGTVKLNSSIRLTRLRRGGAITRSKGKPGQTRGGFFGDSIALPHRTAPHRTKRDDERPAISRSSIQNQRNKENIFHPYYKMNNANNE